MDDQDTNKQKLLRLIEGGKAPGSGNASNAPDKVQPGRVGLAESGLTLKQEAFVQELAKGSTNSDAYRASYNCDGMASSTVHQEASRLATNPKIAARLNAVLDQKRLVEQRAAAKASDRVNAKAWAMIENPDTPPAVVANLLNLQAKINGMLTDKIEVSNAGSVADLEKELRDRLARYVSP
jgi:hypothetical protein